MKLHGIFPPITTPFDHAGELYMSKVQHNIDKWNRTGLAGYVVCGSTGESVYLTTEEKIRLWEWVAEAAAPEKLLIAGTGVESVRETVELTNRAASLGYKAAMVDRKSTRLNSSHQIISYAVFCLKKKKTTIDNILVARTPVS